MRTPQISVKNALLATLLVAPFFISCQKELSSVETAAEKEAFANNTSASDAEAEGVFDDVLDNVIGVDAEVGMPGVGVFGSMHPQTGGEIISGVANTMAPCFTVTKTQLNAPARFPLKVVIDFGTGCTDKNGHTRTGKIITEYSGPLFVPGNSTTTRFDGYTIDSLKIDGTHKVVNKSTADKRIMHIVVIGAKITRPNGNYTQWNSEKDITQIEGLGTPLYPLDDIFNITGAANGAVKNGDKFYQWSKLIVEPLVKRFTCRWFVRGLVAMKNGDKPVAELNYGAGDCDNKATLTVNGTSKEITLR
jgi:hypothetical protein